MLKAKLLLIAVIMLAMSACASGGAPKTGASPAPAAGAASPAPAAGAAAGNPEAKALANQIVGEVNKITDKLKAADSGDAIVAAYKDGAAALRPLTIKMREKFPDLYKEDPNTQEKAKQIVGDEANKKMEEAGGKMLEASSEAEKRNNVSAETNADLKAAGEDLFKALSGQ